MELYHEFDNARGAFAPTTPRGKTRFEMMNRGPLRPGKTRADKKSGAWSRCIANKRNRAMANANA